MPTIDEIKTQLSILLDDVKGHHEMGHDLFDYDAYFSNILTTQIIPLCGADIESNFHYFELIVWSYISGQLIKPEAIEALTYWNESHEFGKLILHKTRWNG